MFIRLTGEDTEKPHDILIYWRAVQGIEKTNPSGSTKVHTTFGTRFVKELPNEIMGLIEDARDLESRTRADAENVCPA